MHRREFFLGTIGTGIATLGGDCIAAPAKGRIRAALKQTVGGRDKVAGMVAVAIVESGLSRVSYGSSGVSNVAMDAHAVFDIGSITKVTTALLLADMAERGEVAVGDSVAKYLPASVTVRERRRPITLLDLATYTCGLPKLPGNLPPNWWTSLIHSPITRPISSMSSSRAMCRNTSRAPISNIPVSASDCSE